MAVAMVIIVNIFSVLSSLRFFTRSLPLFLAADVLAGSVTVSWTANTETNIGGYRLRYGTVSDPYSSVVDVPSTSATIKSLKRGVTYTFAATAFNTSGAESEYSIPVSITIGAKKYIPPAALINISSRAVVHTGENVLIGGFIVDGVVAKKVALRAIGPSLANYGVVGAMSDPVLQIIDATGVVVVTNDSWNFPGEEVSAYGLAPSDAREAAVVATLEPGSYSAVVSGKSSTTGVALFDLYDLDAQTGRVANISTRSRVESGDNVMIGGFILGGTTGTQVIVRAIGPSLVPNGVTDALLDPTLELYDSNGSLLASNDNWRTSQEGAIVGSTVPPTDNREAAIVATLAPGAYSGIIRGANGTTGVALFEVFALNQ
ncbi:MAG: fibronectin type III domain-containing protein [Chthoniobacterales bacterium]